MATTWAYGNSGWVCLSDTDLPGPLYVRLAYDGAGRPFISEVYLDGRGQEVTGEALSNIRPRALAEWLDSGERDHIQARMRHPGPDLTRLASYFGTSFGSQAHHWAAESMRAQIKDSGVTQPSRGRPLETAEDPEPYLVRSDGLTDAFLGQVAEAYAWAVRNGQSPGQYVHGRMQPGCELNTVRAWFRLARKRGLLAPGKPGRVV